jgi:hypothetical protein
MARATAAILCLALAGCDVVTDRYESVAEARRERLFERGWLPDILPTSAVRIRVSNNLDLNRSEGEFSFSSPDFSAFQSRLASGVPSRAPFNDWPGFVQGKLKDGYAAAAFEREGYKWVFICHERKGHCLYRMWLSSAG